MDNSQQNDTQSDLLTQITEPAKKDHKELIVQIEVCKRYRRKLAQKWQLNIDYRKGKPFSTQSDSDRINVNIDWSVTKAKQASLFSQIPRIRVNHPPQTTTIPWVHNYEQRVNDILVSAGIESAMEEILPDCINATGLGIVVVSREALTEDVEIPAIDLSFFPPEEQVFILTSKTLPDGSPLPTTTVPRVLDQRYIISRVSGKDFLWPIDFAGSDFDNAPWIGRTGKLTWTEAKKRFKLREEDKRKYVGLENLDHDLSYREPEKATNLDADMVRFDEIFYKEFQYDDNAKSFLSIHHLIFLGNEKEPIIDEPWKGQRSTEHGDIIGSLKYPIRVLTLTYVTDEAIPPSDSAIIRPQVDELNESRTQIIMQRKHSLPVRWFDVNRVDPTIQTALMRGIWQHMIPIQGQGTNAIGEVSRAAMSQENYVFDRIAKADIQELMQLGPVLGGNPEVKKDAQDISQSRISKERARVSKFVIGIAEVIGGLVCLYEDPNSLGNGFDPAISKALSYSILSDSTVILDSKQRLQQLFQFINFTAKSGWVDIESVLKEIATLSGLDPALVIKKPEPRPPAEPNISLRLTGTEDMLNPLALASLINSGQAPTLQQIEQAKQLIQAAVTPSGENQINPILLAMMIKSGQLPMPGVMPQPTDQPPPQMELPLPPPPPIGAANPSWGIMDKVNKRPGEDEE